MTSRVASAAPDVGEIMSYCLAGLREPTTYSIPPFRERLRVVVPLLQPVVRAALVAGSELTYFVRCQHVAPGAIRAHPGTYDHPIRVDEGVLAYESRGRHRLGSIQTLIPRLSHTFSSTGSPTSQITT